MTSFLICGMMSIGKRGEMKEKGHDFEKDSREIPHAGTFAVRMHGDDIFRMQ